MRVVVQLGDELVGVDVSCESCHGWCGFSVIGKLDRVAQKLGDA